MTWLTVERAGRGQRISDDALAYARERFSVEDLRQVLVDVNRRLKANKQFERAKIRGSWS